MGTFEPKDINNLTEKQKENALESLAVMNEKQDGRIKCRACANGSKAASRTVATESVLLTGVIYARKG
eukprot:10688761-Ditylum_brightwellii.AAC.1